jgi:hypothetical protein
MRIREEMWQLQQQASMARKLERAATSYIGTERRGLERV